MPERDTRIPIHEYRGFSADWENLPSTVKDELGNLFDQLEKNPYSPSLQSKCEIDGNENFAYKLPQGYVIYWKVVSKPWFLPNPVTSLDGMEIHLTELRKPPGAR